MKKKSQNKKTARDYQIPCRACKTDASVNMSRN